MDTNNWRPPQVAEPSTDAGDWRSQLQPDSRQRIVNTIMDKLKRQVPFSGQEGLEILKNIAVRFEEMIYTAATSQSDYLHKIALKMHSVEAKSLQSNFAGNSSRPPDPVFFGMQPQDPKQRQSLDMPLSANQSQSDQQLLSQNNIPHSGLQSSAGLSSVIPPSGLTQTNIPSIVGQNPNMQSMSGTSQNSLGNSMGYGVRSHSCANSQRQMQGRQQVFPQQQQKSQNSQSSQQSVMQTSSVMPSVVQSSLPSLHQNQLHAIQQSTQSRLEHHPQIVLRKPQQEPQEASVQGLQQQHQTSLDPTSQTVHATGCDWQEVVYQKIKVMKEMYLPKLSEMYQKTATKLQQHESLSQQPKSEQLDKLKMFKTMLERLISVLQISKSRISPGLKDELVLYEKQIVNLITNTNRPRMPVSSLQQGELPAPHMHSMQQSQFQITQGQSHEIKMFPQLQSMNSQGSVATMPLNSSEENYVSSFSGFSTAQQNIMNSLQPSSNMGSGQGTAQNSLQQVAVGLIQQTPILQKQQILQEQQQQANQQLQQLLLAHQHQIPPLCQMNDVNDLKKTQGMGVNPGVLQQCLSAGQRAYLQQQWKSGSPYPISSTTQLLQAASPQISQQSSPQVDQQNLLTHPKAGTCSSPLVIPSPRTSMAPAPTPGVSEKPSSLSNAGNIGHQPAIGVGVQVQSLAIGTPGISASPLLAESCVPDGTHVNSLSTISGKSSVTEQPLERLIKVVKSMSPNALSASVSDIGSVVSMSDRVAGSAPGNGSRAAVGEDLIAMAKCPLQEKNVLTRDGTNGSRKMRRHTSAMPLNVVSSACNDSFMQLSSSQTADLESTAISRIKRPRIEANNALLEEIRDIRQRFTNIGFDITDEDDDRSVATADGGEGTIFKCFFDAVAFSPNLKSQYASAQMSPIQPLRLLIPTDYPNSSPILLDKFPAEVSKVHEDLSVKAKSRFSTYLRSISEPMSLGEIARIWDVCARAVISEHAQQSGGGSFSSKYGSWENCLSAA